MHKSYFNRRARRCECGISSTFAVLGGFEVEDIREIAFNRRLTVVELFFISHQIVVLISPLLI